MENNIEKIRLWCKREWDKNIGLFEIILFLLILFGLIAVVIFVVNNHRENNTKYIIDILQIILSWPTLGIIAFLVFITKFRESIEIFLSNHKPKFPGTDERPQEAEKEEIKPKDEKQSRLIDVDKSEEDNFKYLALFFVDTTKKVLMWFFNLKGKSVITYEFFDFTWQALILDSGQRATIFNVLQQNGMIQGVPGGAFSITEKGERFLKFISFIS